jgi:radical SAM protein with 4Fe4S-binding SPASM domain
MEYVMDCGQIPVVEYLEFNKRLFEKSQKNRMPVSGTFDITSRCNLRCIHCYIQGIDFGKELTYPEICNILDQIAEEGCLWLLITGGEPLTRPDFMGIYEYAKRKGFFITLFTNGTLLTTEIADFLVEFPPFAIEITLYGITADTYEKVTGVPGAFERCRRGIELLRERNLYLRLKSMIFTTNRHELEEIKSYAKKLGAPFRFDCMINAKLDNSQEPTKVRLSPDEIVALDMADKERSREFRAFADRFGDVPESEYLYNCGAGLNSFYISATGHLGMCAVSHEPNYDLRKGNFHDGFYYALPEVRTKKRTRYSECQKCDLKGICNQCPAWGQLEHGDPEARVDFLCRVAHLRAAALLNHEPTRTAVKKR